MPIASKFEQYLNMHLSQIFLPTMNCLEYLCTTKCVHVFENYFLKCVTFGG